jgi:hypothetical protein
MLWIVSLMMVVFPAGLCFVGNTVFGLVGGFIGLAVGLVPGMWSYFSWIRSVQESMGANHE